MPFVEKNGRSPNPTSILALVGIGLTAVRKVILTRKPVS